MQTLLETFVAEAQKILPIGSQWVSPETETPYCTYQYSAEELNQNREITVTLDVWDRNTSPVRIEGLVTDLRDSLDRNVLVNGDHWVMTTLQSQRAIPEDEPETKRIQMVFMLKYYKDTTG